MNRTKLIFIGALLLVLAAVLFWRSNRKTNPLLAWMHSPIEFYGIVLDQENQPVPSAKVEASVLDNPVKGTPITATTGADGRFTIKSKGGSLHILVSKSGYYHVNKNGDLKPSSQGFDFGVDTGRGIHQPDKGSPTVFQLRKFGNPVPLERLAAQASVPRDGRAITAKLSKTGTQALRISCLTLEDATQLPNAPYDWRCEIIIVGGGIQEAQDDEHSFIAPSEGYTASAVIDMPKSLDRKQWKSRASKYYWLRFSDNTFGKISFMMIARGDHFFELYGHRNATPGDRNLEAKLERR